MGRHPWTAADAGRLHDCMHGHVLAGELPGAVTLVARGDHAEIDAVGTLAFGNAAPMQPDSIFRIASLTKPIAAVAAMILVDDGALCLDASVDDLLPELADRRVLRSIESEMDDTVPAERSITVLDVLTLRLGFGSLMVPPNTYPVQRAEEALQLATLGPPWPPTPHSPDEWIHRLGTLPLMCQPGEQWLYNTGAQVLGVLIERAAGVPLEQFLRDRLFGPLGMVDTGFSVRPDQRHRFTTAYELDPTSGQLQVIDDVQHSLWALPPAMPNAAGWLVSTVEDFWMFAAMLWHGGVHAGHQIVSRDSLERMLTDHLTDQQRAASAMFLGDHSGWGLGLSVPASSGLTGVPAGYGWSGGSGTTWASDPLNDLTGMLFTQRAMSSPQPPAVFDDFWHHVYGALAG